MVAAILTRVGVAEAISKDLSWEYTHLTGFNDLGSSAYPVDPKGKSTDAKSATTCKSSALCEVKTGWDGPSGVGTPNGTALASIAGGGSPPPTAVDAGAPPKDASAPPVVEDASVSASDDAGGTGSGSGNDAGSGSDSGSGNGSGLGNVVDEEDGGAEDAGEALVAGPSSSSGCACATPGGSGAPTHDTGLAALAVGAVALASARRRKR
jgi:MYXO-CTERM domain-containing protein